MEIQGIRLIRFTWPGAISIQKNNAQKRNDADGELQKVSGRCLILCSDHYVISLRIPFIKITMQTIDKLAGICPGSLYMCVYFDLA